MRCCLSIWDIRVGNRCVHRETVASVWRDPSFRPLGTSCIWYSWMDLPCPSPTLRANNPALLAFILSHFWQQAPILSGLHFWREVSISGAFWSWRFILALGIQVRIYRRRGRSRDEQLFTSSCISVCCRPGLTATKAMT